MTYEELMAKVSDDAEAKSFLEALNVKATNADSLTEKVNSLELKSKEAISSRQSLKELVKSITGLTEISEESLKGLVDTSTKGDEKLTAELTNLKGLLEKANGEKSTIVTDYETKLQKLALDNEIANSGVGASFANEAMFKLGIDLIKSGATYEDGKIVYKNPDDSTAYNASNAPMSIADKISSLKSDTNYSGLFKPDVNGGSGSPQSNPNGGASNGAKDMTPDQMMNAGRGVK